MGGALSLITGKPKTPRIVIPKPKVQRAPTDSDASIQSAIRARLARSLARRGRQASQLTSDTNSATGSSGRSLGR